jgi:heme/copper-type cytochrome/quinol oxidase subunit 2
MIDSLDFAPNSAEEQMYLRQMRQTRICIWVILLGLLNFLAYVVGYSYLYGEALHGEVLQNGTELIYKLHTDKEVSRGAFLYSGIHSISVWLTVGAILLAMLTLAKERIVSSASRTILRGRTLITVLATIITVTIVVITVEVTLEFVRSLRHPKSPEPTPVVETHDVDNSLGQ